MNHELVIMYLLNISANVKMKLIENLYLLDGDFVMILTSCHKKGRMNNDINTSQ